MGILLKTLCPLSSHGDYFVIFSMLYFYLFILLLDIVEKVGLDLRMQYCVHKLIEE